MEKKELKISLEELKTLLESESFKIQYNEDNETDKLNILRNLVDEKLKEYNLVVNWYDFDYERIYHKGYEDSDDWEEDYITSFRLTYSENLIEIEL